MYARTVPGDVYPYPQPYPVPAYGPPPGFGAPPRAKTPQGLRWALVGIILAIVYFALNAVVGLLLGQAFSGPPPATIEAYLAQSAGQLAAGVVTGIVGILLLVFYLIAYGYLYSGRNEFGPTHARNLRLSLILVIVAVALGVANIVAVAMINMRGVRVSFGFPFTVEVDPGMFYLGAVVKAILGITVSALVAAHLVLSVRALAKPTHQIVLYIAAALGTATPGIEGSLTLLQMPQVITYVEGLAGIQPGFGVFLSVGVDPSWGLPWIVAGSLGALTVILFLWAYYAAGVLVRTGELKPVLPTPAPVAPWAQPPTPFAPPPMYPVPSVPPAGPQGPVP